MSQATYLMVYEIDGALRTALCPGAPAQVSVGGSVFNLRLQWCWDFNYLRDKSGKLVGFKLVPTWLDPEDRFFRSSLLRATSDDRVPRINLNNDRSLNLLLSDCNDPIEENTLGTFGSLLETSCGRSMIGLPEWKEWGETAFPPAALKEFIVERWDQ